MIALYRMREPERNFLLSFNSASSKYAENFRRHIAFAGPEYPWAMKFVAKGICDEPTKSFRGRGILTFSLSRLGEDLLQELLDEFERPRELGPPTLAEPGSQQKVEVLRKRALAGFELFHPQDNLHMTEFRG